MISGCGFLLINTNIKENIIFRNILGIPYDTIGIYYENSTRGQAVHNVLIIDIFGDRIPIWTQTFIFEDIIKENKYIEYIDVYKIKKEVNLNFRLLFKNYFGNPIQYDIPYYVDKIINNTTPNIHTFNLFIKSIFGYTIYDIDKCLSFETVYRIHMNPDPDPGTESNSSEILNNLIFDILKYILSLNYEDILNLYYKKFNNNYNIINKLYKYYNSKSIKEEKIKTCIENMLKTKEIHITELKELIPDIKVPKYNIYVSVKGCTKILSETEDPSISLKKQLIEIHNDIKNNKLINLDINKLTKNISLLYDFGLPVFDDTFTIKCILFSKGNNYNSNYEEIVLDDGLTIIPSKGYSIKSLSIDDLKNIYEFIKDKDGYISLKNDIKIELNKKK